MIFVGYIWRKSGLFIAYIFNARYHTTIAKVANESAHGCNVVRRVSDFPLVFTKESVLIP